VVKQINSAWRYEKLSMARKMPFNRGQNFSALWSAKGIVGVRAEGVKEVWGILNMRVHA
jgi:hypothetical protein